MNDVSSALSRPIPLTMPILLTLGIFLADGLAPSGIAVSVLYVIPLLLTFFSDRERAPVVVCTAATALLWADLAFNPADAPPYALVNRTLGTGVLWLIAWLLDRHKRATSSLETAEIGHHKVLEAMKAERADTQGLLTAAQEARAYAETAVMGALAGRRQAEERYLITQLRLEGIIQAAMDAILTVDDRQCIVMFNHAAERMFGYSRADALGQPLDRFIPARFREAHRRHVENFGGSGVTARKMGALGTVTGLKAGGEEFPVEASISQVAVEGKRFYTVILRDLTERRRMEEQLRRTERIAELGTVASGMAHEIGTPMNVILGRAEYLLDRVREEPVRKGLQTIIVQVERITRVMNQLLAFTRRKPPMRGPLDLKTVVENTVEMFHERLAKTHTRLELNLAPLCPAVWADADQISQVLINLIMNALHAMPEQGTLRIGLEPRTGHVALSVSDTGQGIPPEIVGRIFEPFFTTKEFGKGTGLGLTVVKGIVDEHQGSIAVQSEPGKGTTFTILLPKASEDGNALSPA